MIEYLMLIMSDDGLPGILPSREEYRARAVEASTDAAPHVIAEDAAEHDELSPELSLLSDIFGALVKGKVINTTLKELLSILPRKRRRADAYKGLVSTLNQRGVTLNILSRKKSYEQEDFNEGDSSDNC